jgi:hypothetical protein
VRPTGHSAGRREVAVLMRSPVAKD